MNIIPEEYDNCCYIVGGGTSLKNFDWKLLDDKFVIAINTAYTKLPNAQILYCTDPPWITAHLKDLEKFKGLIYQGAINCTLPKKLPVVDKQWRLTRPEGLETTKDCLSHGSNSTMAATNMAAVHLGFKKIYLLGIDMQWGNKGNKNTSHWHSSTNPHQRVDPESVYARMLIGWKSIKQPLLKMGIDVINVNNPYDTALREFPIKTHKEVFNL